MLENNFLSMNDILDEFCCYCGKQFKYILSKSIKYTVDHLVPVSKGGSNSVKNKRPCCSKCNGDKGNKTIQQYVLFLERETDRIKKEYQSFPLALQSLLDLNLIKLENAKYIAKYVKSAGEKLYKNKESFYQWNNKSKILEIVDHFYSLEPSLMKRDKIVLTSTYFNVNKKFVEEIIKINIKSMSNVK